MVVPTPAPTPEHSNLDDHLVDALIYGPAVVGLLASALQWTLVSNVKIEEFGESTTGEQSQEALLVKDQEAKALKKYHAEFEKWEKKCIECKAAVPAKLIPARPLAPPTGAQRIEKLKEISDIVSAGAMAFLNAEYQILAIYIILFAILLGFITSWASSAAFVVGALTSIVSGYIGMKIAVYTNSRTAYQCWKQLDLGFTVAINGGTVMGISLVSVGVLALYLLILVFRIVFLKKDGALDYKENLELYENLASYGLGGSSIALFGRVGGGIFTKAADVGADLAGKNDFDLAEDDYRNPGCIADNVGDNVGDIAGMGADLFGSFAEATCAALVIGASSHEIIGFGNAAILYPLIISSVGILVGYLTIRIVLVAYPVTEEGKIEFALKIILVLSTALMTPVVYGLSVTFLPPKFSFDLIKDVTQLACFGSIALGLWSGLFIGLATEYYTSHSWSPVREIAVSQRQTASTGIIYGLALGYLSCIIPVLCLGVSVLVAHSTAGMYGVALSALGMLGTMTLALTIDAYGPISDNAGGLAEMAGLPEHVRKHTDALDAAGNTTAAIGKGFAIGSAALVGLALFGAYCVRAEVRTVDVLDAWVFTFLLFGAMLPYAFAALTMKSVGLAAQNLYIECIDQFNEMAKLDWDETKFKAADLPNYHKCIDIATKASLKEMIAPGILVLFSPLVAGLGFGKNACAGLLTGALASSVQLAISMSNTGGAWDNSKKYISAGNMEENGVKITKDSEDPTIKKLYTAMHQNSVTGDTVGDPLKDTSGPALNIVMKLTAIISLVFAANINGMSNIHGGPCWMDTTKKCSITGA